MASKKTKEQGGNLHLTIDTKYVDQTFNYDESIILSPSGSTQKLIQDGKIRECFVSLKKQNLNDIFKNPLDNSLTDIVADDDQTVPVLQHEQETSRYDHNANEYFEQENGKGKRRSPGRSKKKQTTKSTLDATDTRNLFASFSNGTPNLHHRSSNFEGKPSMDVDHKEIIEKAKVPVGANPSVCLRQEFSSAAVDTTFLVNLGDIADTTKPIEHTCGLKSKEEEQVSYKRRKKRRYPDVFRPDREDLALIKRVKNGRTVANKDFTGHDTSGVENYANSCSNKNVADRNSNSNPLVGSKHAPIKAHVRNTDEGFSNLEVSNSDQENSKLQHLNFCAKHKAAISKWKAQTGDKTDQLKNLGPSQLQASQEGSDHPVFQDNINSLPVDNISSTNEGRIKKQGVIDNENLNNQNTDTNSSQDTNECQSDSVSDQNRLMFSQTSSSTIVSQGIQDSITAQNDSQSLLNSPLDEREVVVAALIDMSNEMFSRQGVQCKEHESVNESSTDSTQCSPEELAVTDSNQSTLIESVRTPQSYVAVNKQYTMQALTQAVESVIEQERNSLQDVGQSKSELACFQMDSDEGSKSELPCMQIDTINQKENEISLNQSDDASTSAEYLSNSTVINGPQGESVSVLYSSQQEQISEKVLQEQRVEKRSFQVTSSDSLIDPVENLQTQSKLMIPVDPYERDVDKEESVRDTQTPVDINQGLQILSSSVTTDQSQTLVESAHETLQSGSRILRNQQENFAMITQNAVEDEERHHKVSTDEPMLHSVDALKRPVTELQTNSLMHKEMGNSLTTICKSKDRALIEDLERPEIVNSKTTIQQSPNQVDKLIAEVQFQSGVSEDQNNTMEENCKEVSQIPGKDDTAQFLSSKENQAVESGKIDAVILTSSEVDEKTLESESVIQSDRTNPLEQEHNSLEEDYTLQSSDSGVTMQPTLNGIEESTADQQSQSNISEDRLDLSKKSSADFEQEDTHVSHVTIGKSLNVDETYEEKLQTRISNNKEASSKQTPGEIAQKDTEGKILPSDEVLKSSLDSTQSSFVELQTESRISGHEVNNSTYTNMSFDKICRNDEVLYWAANPHEPKTDNRDNITREITEIAETSTEVKPTPNDAENQWAEIHCNATAKARLDEIINVLGQKISHQTPSSSDSDDTHGSKQLDQCDVERKLQRDSNDNIEGNENESLSPGQNDRLKDNVAADFGQCQNRMDSDVTADKANSNQALRDNVKLLGTCGDENHVHISPSEESTNECKEQIPNEKDEIQIDREHIESSPDKNAELSDHKHKSDSPNIQSESGNESNVVKVKDTDVLIPPTLHEEPVNGPDANTSTQRRSRKQTTPQHTPYIQLRNPWKDVSHNSGTEEIRELLLNNRPLQPVQGIANGNQQCPRFQGPYSQRSNQQAYLPTDIKTNMEKPGGKARVQIVTMPDGNRVVVRFDEHGSPIIPLNTQVPSGMIDLQSTVYHRDLHTSSLHQPIGEVSAVPAAEHHQVAAADINKSAEQNDTSTLGQVLPTGLPQQVQHVMQSVPPPPKKEGAVSQVLELSRMYLKTLETAAGREAVISDIERLEKISKGVNRQPVAITELAIAANGDALNRHLQKINGHTTDNNQGGGENSDLINRIAAAEIQRLQQMQNLELQEERLRQEQIARLHQQKLVNETNQGRKGQGFKHHLRAQHETPQEQELRLQQLRQQHQLYLQHQQQSEQQQSQQLPQKNPVVGRYIQQKLKEKQARNQLRNLQQAQQYSIQQQAMNFQQQTSHHTEMQRQQIPVEQLVNQYPFQIQPQTSTERTHQRTHELYIQRQLQIQQQRQAMQQKQKSKLMTPKSVKEQLHLQRTQQLYGGLDQVLPHKQIEHTTNDPTLPRIVEVKSMSQESKPPDQFIALLKLNQQVLQNEPVADNQLMSMQAGVPTTLDNSYASRQIEQIVQKHMVKTSEAVLIPEHLFNVSDTHGNLNTVQTLSSNTTFNYRSGPPVLPNTTPTIPFQTPSQNTAQQYLVKTGPGTGPRCHPIAAFEQSSRVGMINQSIPKSALPVYRHPPPPYPHPHNTANMKATVQQNHNMTKESIIHNGSDKEQMSDLTLPSSDYFKQISSQVNSILTPHGLVPVISLDRLKTLISSNPKQHILQKGDIIANSAPSYCPTKQSNGGTKSSPVMPPVPSEDDKTKAHLPKTSCENGNNENLSTNAIAKCTNKETDQEGQKAVSEKGNGEADTINKENPKEISQPSLPIDKADKDFFYLMLDQLGIQDLGTNIPVMPRSAIQQSGPMLIPIYAENVPSKIANSHRVTDEARSNSPGSTAKEEHQTSSDGISFSDFIQMISKISVNGHNNTDNLKVTESGSTPITTSTTAADATSLIPEDNDLSENNSDKDTPRREWSVVSSTSGKENPDEAPLKLKLKISKISDSSNKRKRGRPKGSTNKRKRSEDGDVESDDPEPPQYHLCQFCDYTHRFRSVVRQHVKLVHFAKFSTAPLKFPKTKKAKPLQITNERRRNTFSGIPSNPITDISIQRQLSDGSSNCSSAHKLQTIANPPISTKLPNENSCQKDSKEDMNAEINCDQRIGKDYVPQLQSGQLETNLSNEGVTEQDHDAKAPEHVNQIKDNQIDPTVSSKAVSKSDIKTPEREIVTDTQPSQMESQNNKGSCHDENGLSEIQEGPEEAASSSEDSCKEKEIYSEANDSNSGGSQLLQNDVLDLEEEDHECNQCKQRFPTPEKLFTHCKLVHSNTKGLHLCYTCGYTTRVASILQRHIMKWHSRGTKHTCTSKSCGKTFGTAEELKQHMREHFGKRKYECRLCGSSYHYINGLRAHQVRHTYDYPFKCGQCGLKFKTKGMLERHEFQRKHFSG